VFGCSCVRVLFSIRKLVVVVTFDTIRRLERTTYKQGAKRTAIFGVYSYNETIIVLVLKSVTRKRLVGSVTLRTLGCV
jgi:hypothetical protein